MSDVARHADPLIRSLPRGDPRLYMAGSALNFEAGGIKVHQVLGVKPGVRGESGMPSTRAQMLG